MVTNTAGGIIQAGTGTLRDSEKAGDSRVSATVEAAYRRRIFVLTIEQLGVAVTFLAAGLIVMLLLGTQILSWYWLVLLAAAGLGIVVLRVRRSILSPYRVAQIVDRRLRLPDLLSTAWFLVKRPGARDALAERQIGQAGSAAEQVILSDVFPLEWRRAWALTGALAAVALGLFVLRYLVTNSLSIREALVPIDFSLPGRVIEQLEKPLLARNQTPDEKAVRARASDQAKRAETRHEKGAAQDEKLPRPEIGKSNGNGAGQGTAKSNLANAGAKASESQGHEKSPAGNREQPAPGAAGQQDQGQPSEKSQNPDAKEAQGAEAASGIMDRMKDALSSLMQKMRPPQGSQPGADKGRDGQDQKAGEQASAQGRDGQPQEPARDSPPNEQSSGEQAQGHATEKSLSGQSHASDQSADKKGANSQSGIGKQDGQKDLKEAEQLRSMGKLAELIGKRSANLTGDISIETSSGQQQLKTQYSGRTGRHSDAGGVINREEIPLAFQQYVHDYMQAVRKQADHKTPQNSDMAHP